MQVPAAVSSAQSGTFDGWLVKNVNGGICLSNPEGSYVRLNTCDSENASQAWFWDSGSIRNLISFLCLDSNSAGDVYMLQCNGGTYQQWSVDGQNRRVNKQTGRCLARTTGTYFVRTEVCSSTNRHQWVTA
ncbi:RICIN domain-containing protein [Streptomyces sp. NPDC096105]|uniref:RICIN domain-containing protein n=1 Tax=Streptomyces sp. NPDC096105 TaxID=3366074 RepID=UPI0038041A16